MIETANVVAPGIYYAPQAIADKTDGMIEAVNAVSLASPFRIMQTQRGHAMSAQITNCGEWGWVSDRKGYRYTRIDPLNNHPWPIMPEIFRTLAMYYAAEAGYTGFSPDVCLINRYVPGAKMGLHQDKDERDFDAPIVSFSLGLPAVMLWSREKRGPVMHKLPLMHGDVLVFGGVARLYYHGIAPIPDGSHVTIGGYRLNLTFRQTGL